MLEGTKLTGIIIRHKDYFVKCGYKKNIALSCHSSQIKKPLPGGHLTLTTSLMKISP
jgi:hypothetical protein